MAATDVRTARRTNRRSTRVARTEVAALRERADRLLRTEIGFISHPSFALRSAANDILNDAVAVDVEPENMGGLRMPSHLSMLCAAPLLTDEEERSLFRRLNFLRYRANLVRSQLSTSQPSESKMDQIESDLSEAHRVKQRIVRSNIRLVISLIKNMSMASGGFDELLSDGLLAMIRAADKFDFSRGFRFSTYATMVVRRHMFRCMKNESRDRGRLQSGDQSLLQETPQEESQRIGYEHWLELNRTLEHMLADLDQRERDIIRARFGFDSDGKKRTLQALAADFGVCKERVRQLENRAMKKLRESANSFGLAQFAELGCFG